MTAPDPAAALRRFGREFEETDVRDCDRIENPCGTCWWCIDEAEAQYLDSAPALLAYVERLEAALVDFASAIDGQAALDESHTCEDGDECSQHCLACHETIRLYHAEADAEQRILVIGREIRERRRG